jgi:hypothetical protein
MLRYAGEFSGFRVAAGIGYERITDHPTQTTIAGTLASANEADISAWGGSLALMHVPSGLFVQGQYMAADFGDGLSSAYWNDFVGHKDADAWQIQAGIAKNWTGLGNTAIYGEYSKQKNWGAGVGVGKDFASPTTATDTVPVFGVTDSEQTVYGIGLVQNIDAAATSLYIGWRHFSTDVTCTGNNNLGTCNEALADDDPVVKKKLAIEDVDVIAAGAIVRF